MRDQDKVREEIEMTWLKWVGVCLAALVAVILIFTFGM